MSALLHIEAAGPAVTIQDLGRPGYLAQGLTKGGAMDPIALHEAAALLDQPLTAAIEMIGMGGTFTPSRDVRIALTGAPMQASCDTQPLIWNATHTIPAGAKLKIGGVRSGAIGYLTLGGGFDLPDVMGARSAHVSAGLGTRLDTGTALPLAADTGTRVGWVLPLADRFAGGTIAMVRSLQTHLYGEDVLAEFARTSFIRDPRANRQGIRMAPPEGTGFLAQGGLTVVSEIIAPGDIQVTGDGAPFVLMREHQTTGGYPRIGTVIPSHIARVAQAPLGAQITFEVLDLDQAIAAERKSASDHAALAKACKPLIRDPADMADLLSYNLIDGVLDARRDPLEG
ncbi:MAG: urea amidolyase [Aliishimia sp.]